MSGQDDREREDLPLGWVETTLGEICSKISDGSHNPPKAQETGLPMLSAKNIQKNKIVYSEFRLIDEQEFEKEDKRTQVNSGDVLLTIVGAIGRTAIVPPNFKRFTLQRSVAVLKLIDINSQLVGYLLESPVIQKYFSENAKGTAQKGIYLKALAKTPIPLPPLAEQQRIADKLDTLFTRVEAARQRLERVPKLLKQFRQSVLSAAVSGELTREWRGGGEKEWEEVTLGEILGEKPRNGYSPKSVDYETPIRTLTLSATTTGKFDATKFKYIDKEISAESHLFLKQGDILIQRANSIEYVGVSAIYTGQDNDFIYPDLMMKCRASKKVLTEFLYFILSSESVRKFFRDNATGTAGNMPKINQQIVISAPSPLPPLPEQEEIVRRVEALFAIADRLEKHYQTALASFERLTPSLLAKAFRGELVPQNPNDEPVSVLLERIREQRAAEAAKGKKAKGKRKPKAKSSTTTAKRGRPPKTAEIDTAKDEAEAIKRLQERKQEKATKLVGLFEK